MFKGGIPPFKKIDDELIKVSKQNKFDTKLLSINLLNKNKQKINKNTTNDNDDDDDDDELDEY